MKDALFLLRLMIMTGNGELSLKKTTVHPLIIPH